MCCGPPPHAAERERMAQLTPHAGRPKNNPKGKKKKKKKIGCSVFFFFFLFCFCCFSRRWISDSPLARATIPSILPFSLLLLLLLLFCSAVSCLYILYSSTALIELILTAGDIQCRAGPPQQPNPNNSAIDAAAAAAAAAGNKPLPPPHTIHSRL